MSYTYSHSLLGRLHWKTVRLNRSTSAGSFGLLVLALDLRPVSLGTRWQRMGAPRCQCNLCGASRQGCKHLQLLGDGHCEVAMIDRPGD